MNNLLEHCLSMPVLLGLAMRLSLPRPSPRGEVEVVPAAFVNLRSRASGPVSGESFHIQRLTRLGTNLVGRAVLCTPPLGTDAFLAGHGGALGETRPTSNSRFLERILRYQMSHFVPTNPFEAPEARPEGSPGRKPGVRTPRTQEPRQGRKNICRPCRGSRIYRSQPRAHARGYLLVGSTGLRCMVRGNEALSARRHLSPQVSNVENCTPFAA